jgi:hypothetical protein
VLDPTRNVTFKTRAGEMSNKLPACLFKSVVQTTCCYTCSSVVPLCGIRSSKGSVLKFGLECTKTHPVCEWRVNREGFLADASRFLRW